MADVALSKLVEACFNKYDTNKDGKINLVELSDVLGELAREENPLHIMMKYGSEGKIGLHTLIGALENHQGDQKHEQEDGIKAAIYLRRQLSTKALHSILLDRVGGDDSQHVAQNEGVDHPGTPRYGITQQQRHATTNHTSTDPTEDDIDGSDRLRSTTIIYQGKAFQFETGDITA